MARLALNHCLMGRREIGRAVYESLPSAKFCRENQMIWWLSLLEEEQLPYLRKKVKQDYEALRSSIWSLVDSGCISDEESLIAIEKLFALEKIVCDNGTYPESWGAARLPFNTARLYARLGNRSKAIEYLKIAAEAAKAFDERPEEQMFSSILLGDIVERRIDFETSDTRSLCEIMRDKWLLFHDFDKLRNTDAFKKVVSFLY